MIKRNDIILIGVVILLSLGVLVFLNLTKQEGSELVVTMDGNIYKTFQLNQNTTFTIEGENGTYNTFKIKDGYVDMTDASCPDKICVHHKSIHYNHETIVCLPNKVVLEVHSGEESNVDMIAN